MSNARDQIDNLRIAAPCPAAWEGMAGDERVRHCTLCSLNVYNFGEMTRDEVRELLVRQEGRVCARLYRRADGTVLTRDCPTGLRALRRRAARMATAVVAVLLTLPSFAFAGVPWKKSRLKKQTNVKLEIQQVATPQLAVFTGVVHDETGNPLPGVTVVVRNEVSKKERVAITDATGAFGIASLHDGLYRVEVTLEGLLPATLEHLQLKGSEITQASVILRWDPNLISITVGAIAVDLFSNDDGNTVTVSEDFIRRMPF